MILLTSEEKHIALNWWYQGNTNPHMRLQAEKWMINRLELYGAWQRAFP